MAHDDEQTPAKAWLGRIAAARAKRADLIAEWQENVDTRRGSTRSVAAESTKLTGTTGVAINQDWPLTKAKIAQLYSQTPEVRLSPRYDALQQAVPIFARELNDTIGDAGVGQTVEEILADVINASGIGAALVYYDSRTEPRDVPMVDPSMVPPEMSAQIPTTTVDAVVDAKHCVDRISPADLLVPSDFTGSNYNKARFLGHDGRMTWAQALRGFPKTETNRGLSEADKDKVLGTDKRTNTTQSLNTDTTKFKDSDVVNFTEVFYWRHFYDVEETSFKAIGRIVFVDGIEEPVIDEAYQGQKRGPNGMLGAVKLPIQVLTLTYVSDDSLPPSDSSVSRHQVTELEAARTAMELQRKHSIPLRWGDVNRIGQNTRTAIERGDFQGFIWTNGPGERAVGEVSRASFPQERYEFDHVIKNEIAETWQVGTNQAGAFSSGDKSASEAKIVQQNFQTRIGQERDKVTRFVLGIAEVLAGHLSLYGTFEIPDELGIQREVLATGFTYSVRLDSTVRQDAQQRIDQLERAINFLGQSPYANAKSLYEEYAELNGLSAAKVIIDPQPKPPEPVKVSVSNAVDINDPMFLSLLMRTHQAPTPDELAAAMKLLTTIRGLVPPPQPTGEQSSDPNAPPHDPKTPGIANADWQAAPRIDKRDEDGGA